MTSHVTQSGANPLATADQADIERTALRLLQRPELKQAHAEARNLFLADPLAEVPSGLSTLDQAVDEYVLGTVYDTILRDVSTPRILWAFNPPHRWFGHQIGGARFGIDNPDNTYRIAILDSDASYEIHARRAGIPPVNFSFQLYADNRFSTVLPGDPPSGNTQMDVPLADLFDSGTECAADGSFTITLSPEPANGRANHIQTTPGDPLLFIRETLTDWSTQTPHWMEIRRVGQGAARSVQSDAELAAHAVTRLKSEVPFWLKFNRIVVAARPPNALPPPRARGTGWGFSAIGNLNFASDEALLLTIHPQGARYTGLAVFNPWCITREHIHRSGSLNIDQAHPNPDGSYTYVIAARDPGIANWLDTDGLERGGIIVRWQAFPRQPPTNDGLVREVKLVKLADLEWMLPKDTPRLTPVQRSAELSARSASFLRRFAQ